MTCMICKKQPATVHMTDIKDGKKQEFHICQECAQNQGIIVTAQDALASLLKKFGQAATDEIEQIPDIQCANCGGTYEDFRKRGRLGCANDYEAFREPLDVLLARIHGAQAHVGKSPKPAGEGGGEDRAKATAAAVARLKQELDRAVSAEQYERAAQLRDEIHSLEDNADAT